MHDLLMEWCSERAEGPMTAFREAHEWLSQRAATEPTRDWGVTAYNMQILGHLEVTDTAPAHWAIAPTVLTPLDDSGGNAVLVGARPRWLTLRLHTLEQDPDPRVAALATKIFPYDPIGQPGAPSALFFSARSDETIEDLCRLLEIRFEHRVSDRLREALPDLHGYLTQRYVEAPPPGIIPRRLVIKDRPLWVESEHDDEPGAFEYETYGAPRYIFNDGHFLFEADKGVAIYAELARIGRQVIYYRPSDRSMFVPAALRLPLLAARCAALRTGLLPVFSRDQVSGIPGELGPLNRYRNIPITLHRVIAESVSQGLRTI